MTWAAGGDDDDVTTMTVGSQLRNPAPTYAEMMMMEMDQAYWDNPNTKNQQRRVYGEYRASNAPVLIHSRPHRLLLPAAAAEEKMMMNTR